MGAHGAQALREIVLEGKHGAENPFLILYRNPARQRRSSLAQSRPKGITKKEGGSYKVVRRFGGKQLWRDRRGDASSADRKTARTPVQSGRTRQAKVGGDGANRPVATKEPADDSSLQALC